MEQSTRETTTNIRFNNFLGFIKSVVAFLAVTLSLFHVFFNATSSELITEQKNYKNIVKERDSINAYTIDLFKKNLITKDEYLAFADTHFELYKDKLKRKSKLKKELAISFSFRGRSSFHFWIFVFGLVTALFFFSCKSLHDDFSRGSTFKFHFVSLTGILVSGFWFIHLIFLTQKDFTQNKYVLILIIAASLFAAFTYFLIKYYTYKDQIIYRQLSFIERVKRIYYRDMVFKAMYAEESGKPHESGKLVDNCIDDFHQDLKKVMDNI
ncbi:hypothetical protein ATE84_3820 [Aquimarina sp. MAR_2010_214]|uniref:hypothetical protein n=1 Tax=Aquimarina sp. MAR_2010_214 TaxID=1250026 RepID=UPI000CCADADF|nr:hypothetical protein [Aquimarina sp. MAR_2010_214]PKV51722.1 hypothetical protein ATE84_3820 [Aquimarina sp. MAR_2010_214]